MVPPVAPTTGRIVRPLGPVVIEIEQVTKLYRMGEEVIHALPAPGGDDPAAPTTVVVREDSYWKLCLPVVSILHAREVAAALGGAIRSAKQEWVARGFRAVKFGWGPIGRGSAEQDADIAAAAAAAI